MCWCKVKVWPCRYVRHGGSPRFGIMKTEAGQWEFLQSSHMWNCKERFQFSWISSQKGSSLCVCRAYAYTSTINYTYVPMWVTCLCIPAIKNRKKLINHVRGKTELFFYFFFLIYLLIMLLQLSHSPPTPLHPVRPLPPTFPPIVHVHGSYL